MSKGGAQDTLEALRREFDEGFAAPRSEGEDTAEDLLVVRVGGRKLALRAAETGGVLRCPAFTPLPSRQPALLGLARVRSSLVAVYSLGALLGATEPHSGRWSVLAGARRTLCLVFDELVQYVQAPAEAIRRDEDASGRTWVAVAGELLEVVDLRRVVAVLERTTDVGEQD